MRDCPICGSITTSITFPYATQFNSIQFKYYRCSNCSSVSVNPVPDNHTFSKMYSRDVYHDRYYVDKKDSNYQDSVNLLKKYIDEGATVLDYGCGIGGFLKELEAGNFFPFGVEFDKKAISYAKDNVSCNVWSVDQFIELRTKLTFDVIHLGDVLEHLPDPLITLNKLLRYLKSGGILFVEGPLKINPSPVYWVANIFGVLKRMLKPNFIANHAPTHLFRTGAKQQLMFFEHLNSLLDLKYWRVYETGWPYSEGGIVKVGISKIAVLLSGKNILGMTFGNRFQALLRKN